MQFNDYMVVGSERVLLISELKIESGPPEMEP